MIITNDFVMINFPKTGSSFAREVIKKVYGQKSSLVHKALFSVGLRNSGYIELMLPNIHNATHKFRGKHAKGQHGLLSQIPEKYKGKPVVSIVRNPFSRYVSGYQFKWWEKYPPESEEVIAKKYPHFPDLSFQEFYDMMHDFGRKNRLKGVKPKIDLGIYTIQFIQFFFDNPTEILNKIDDDYIEQELFREDMGNIEFIRQENLNEDLKEFLLGVGANTDELRFLDTMERVNVTKKTQQETSGSVFIEPETRDKILSRDKLIFKLFPEYVSYLETHP